MLRKNVSGIILTLLLMSMLASAFNIQPAKAEGGTIYIRADGSIFPSTASISTVDNVTYYFTDNIYDSIVVERDNIVVDGAGYTVQGSGSGSGVSLGFNLSGISNVTIKRTNIKGFDYGIWLLSSSYCSIYGNNITNNCLSGIILTAYSNKNVVSGNNITANILGMNGCGVWLHDGSNNNTVSQNNVLSNYMGVALSASSYNIISGNNITDNFLIGIRPAYGSTNNIISGNDVTNNGVGVFLGGYLDNTNDFYHNNFINNTQQVELYGSVNSWDDGYPSGGNYWSDYEERYPYASEIDGSGIWDTPYVIDENNQDNYPLVNPWTPTPPPENRPPNPPTLLWQAKVKLYDTEIWLTDLPVGGTIDEDTVALLGEVSDPDGDRVKMQVELRRLDEYDGSFIGISTHESEFVDSEGGAYIIVHCLVVGSYHWQARTIDEHGLVSDWVDFGNNDISEADFKFVIPEKVFRPPYAIGIGDLGFADKSGTGRALYYSYVFPQDGYGTIGADTHVFPGGGYAWAEADFILGDSWTCTYSGEYEIAASIAIDGFMRVFYASAPKWGKGYAMAILKARLSIYDKTDGVEVLQEDLVIFEEKIEWSPLPIQIPRYKLQRYYSTPFSIVKYVYLQQGHEYEWNFRMHMGGYAIVALAGAGIGGGHITAYLNEVRIKPH